jgi:C1A family cysteine protease
MATRSPRTFGWHRDLPDSRDYTPAHKPVKLLLGKLRRPGARSARPAALTWEEYFPPAENQRALASSTAHACAGLVQYFERRAHGLVLDCSCQFLYKMARRLLHWTGDSGATLRATLKALKRFGLPPREHWPYAPDRCDEEPHGFLFSYGREYHELTYLRLDPLGVEGRETLERVKSFVAAGFPVAFGFTVFDSLGDVAEVPFPSCFDAPLGGQAAIATGYDDKLRIHSEKGALRIRTSWGTEWGDGGYGWLPYRYVAGYLAADFWTLLRSDWLGAGEFLTPC